MDRAAPEDVQRWLLALADGDRGAFHPLFLCLWPLLRGFAARFLAWPDAEDAAQNALLRVFSRCGEFDRTREALPWILGIAAYEIRTARRRQFRRRQDATVAPDDRRDPGPSPEDEAAAAERARLLHDVLSRLRPVDAETLLAYARGDRLSLPGATFRKRVERALVRVRAAWSLDDKH